MTDLEITKLCAEAMGLDIYAFVSEAETVTVLVENREVIYRPLQDYAQAVALVNKFPNECFPVLDNWVEMLRKGLTRNLPDVNRLICECVAKRQRAK